MFNFFRPGCVPPNSAIDSSALPPLVADSAALRPEVDALVTAGQLSAATAANLKTALDSIDVSSAAGQAKRAVALVQAIKP